MVGSKEKKLLKFEILIEDASIFNVLQCLENKIISKAKYVFQTKRIEKEKEKEMTVVYWLLIE